MCYIYISSLPGHRLVSRIRFVIKQGRADDVACLSHLSSGNCEQGSVSWNLCALFSFFKTKLIFSFFLVILSFKLTGYSNHLFTTYLLFSVDDSSTLQLWILCASFSNGQWEYTPSERPSLESVHHQYISLSFFVVSEPTYDLHDSSKS